MSCSSAIYTVNQNFTVGANGTIPFGSIIRRFGCACLLEGSSIVCRGRGYYNVDVSASFTPAEAGLIGIQLYADGAPVPGAVKYVTGVAGETVSLSFPALIRVIPCNGATSLTLGLVSPADSTATTTFTNASVVVEKV